jgi:hypothetical protein
VPWLLAFLGGCWQCAIWRVNVAAMNANQSHKLAPYVYAVLVALAFAAALIAFGNEAGWWRIDF